MTTPPSQQPSLSQQNLESLAAPFNAVLLSLQDLASAMGVHLPLFVLPPAPGSGLGLDMPMAITLVGGPATLDSIINWPAGYIRDSDVFLISEPAPVNIAHVNTLASAVHSAFPNNKIGVRTFGLDNVIALRDGGLSNLISFISYIYEDRTRQGDEPEFSSKFSKTLSNYAALASALTGSRFEVWSEPSARGLPHRDYQGWNYGRLAQYVDVLVIQSQRNVKLQVEGTIPTAFTDALNRLVRDMGLAGAGGISPRPGAWYMQITLGTDTNGVTDSRSACSLFAAEMAAKSVPGLMLWPQQVNIDLTRQFMDDWVAARG